MRSKKIIVALDSNNFNKIIKLVVLLKKEVFAFKIGYEFFFNFGIDGYNKINKISPKIFLDLKLHDIPNTVNKAILAINKLKPALTTVHISGGDEMMKVTAIKNSNLKILGVSILTSLDKKQTIKYYNNKNISMLVKKFVIQAEKNNLDGIVCSPHEIKFIRKFVKKSFLIVTPGIRLKKNNISKDDQSRTLTPEEAISLGADLLVIGRPLTQKKNPLKLLKDINKSII